jgi:hypothetical protein
MAALLTRLIAVKRAGGAPGGSRSAAWPGSSAHSTPGPAALAPGRATAAGVRGLVVPPTRCSGPPVAVGTRCN